LNLGYSTALIVIGILSLIFLVFVLFTTFPKVSTGFKFGMVLKVIVKPAVLISALALICYMSLETSMGTWIKKLMEELFGGSTNTNASAQAGLVLSLFGVTLMTGRFLSASVRNLTAMGPKLITLTAALSVAAILLMIIAKGPVLAIIAVLLAGLAFAPIFPTIVGVTFSKFNPSLYGTIFGIIFSLGLLGGTFVPKLIGNLSVDSTVQKSLLIALIIAIALLVISFFIGRIGKPES